MPIGTVLLNKLAKTNVCRRLGVDEFYYDSEKSFNERPNITVEDEHRSMFGKDFTTKRYFHRQFFRFVKDGKKYSFCIDPVVKTETWAVPFGAGEETSYDWEAMEEKIKEVISSNRIYA